MVTHIRSEKLAFMRFLCGDFIAKKSFLTNKRGLYWRKYDIQFRNIIWL